MGSRSECATIPNLGSRNKPGVGTGPPWKSAESAPSGSRLPFEYPLNHQQPGFEVAERGNARRILVQHSSHHLGVGECRFNVTLDLLKPPSVGTDRAKSRRFRQPPAQIVLEAAIREPFGSLPTAAIQIAHEAGGEARVSKHGFNLCCPKRGLQLRDVDAAISPSAFRAGASFRGPSIRCRQIEGFSIAEPRVDDRDAKSMEY